MPRRKAAATAEVIPIGGSAPGRGADDLLRYERPYTASVTIEGTRDFLFHAWSVEAIEEKSKYAKGSAGKKTDNLESYVYRDVEGFIAVPGSYLHAAIKSVGKYRQDPRSPRKSQLDLIKEAIIPADEYARFQPERRKWDYEAKHRALVQRAAITRTWPAFKRGWQLKFTLDVILPQYIDPQYLNELIALSGRIIGIGDYRPTYGRFQVINFEVV